MLRDLYVGREYVVSGETGNYWASRQYLSQQGQKLCCGSTSTLLISFDPVLSKYT